MLRDMTTLHQGKRMILKIMQEPNSIALMFWGTPGIGKSSMVAQAAKELSIGFKPVNASTRMPQDVLGWPYLDHSGPRPKMAYGEPDAFPDKDRDGERGLFFLDELSNCAPAVLQAWNTVILEKTTHDYTFPPGWTIICAGNNAEDRAGSNRLISSTEARVTHISVVPVLQEYTEYAYRNNVHPAVLAFLERFPDRLNKFDSKSPSKAFPNPRSWSKASEILQMWGVPYAAINVSKGEIVVSDEDVGALYDMLAGTIGPGTAIELMAYLSLWATMPPLAAILDGSYDVAALAEEPDLYAGVVTQVLSWVFGEGAVSQEKMNVAMGVLERMSASKNSQEYPMLLFQSLWEDKMGGKPMLVLRYPGWKNLVAIYGKYATPSVAGAPRPKLPSLRKT
jgi:hypothetical protein